MSVPSINHLSEEINYLNFAYLSLAQRMIRADKADAVFQLGISEDVADLLASLSQDQIIRLAMSESMLCKFWDEGPAYQALLFELGYVSPASGQRH